MPSLLAFVLAGILGCVFTCIGSALAILAFAFLFPPLPPEIGPVLHLGVGLLIGVASMLLAFRIIDPLKYI